MFCASFIIGLHLATYHFDRSEAHEEFNPGVYVTCDSGWSAGIYLNSEAPTKYVRYDRMDDGSYRVVRGGEDRRRPSVWVGKSWDNVVGPVDLVIGAALGYRDRAVTPIFLPSVQASEVPVLRDLLPAKTRLNLLLPLEKRGGGVHVSWEF